MNVQIDYALIGQRIRGLRRQAHLTQAELAERTGVCQQFIGCLELGKGIPSLATVMSLCSALAVDPNALLLNCANDDPEASSTLRDVPSLFSSTLASLWITGERPDLQTSTLFAADAFPPYDIPLEDADAPAAD